MKKNTEKKMTLSKETLLNLTEGHQLKEVVGGASKADTLCCPPSGGSRLC
jgi:hypothetical protein